MRDHPLLPLWALVLLLPVALIWLRRRRSGRPYVEGSGVVELPATLDDRGETVLVPRSVLYAAAAARPNGVSR